MTDAVRNYNDGRVVDGVFRWNSNDRIPFADMLQSFVAEGLISQEVATASEAVRLEEAAAFLADLILDPPVPSDEELFEMRAAFGEGATVVNALTGQRFTL